MQQLPKLQCLQQHTDHPVYYDLQKTQHIWNSSPETSRASDTFVFLHVTDMNSLQCWPMMDSMVWDIYDFFVCLWIQDLFIVSPQALYRVLLQWDYQVTKKQSWHSFLTGGFEHIKLEWSMHFDADWPSLPSTSVLQSIESCLNLCQSCSRLYTEDLCCLGWEVKGLFSSMYARH